MTKASSRDEILNDIKANQPDHIPLPSWIWTANDREVVGTFMQSLKEIGGNVMIATSADSVEKDIIRAHGENKRIVNTTSVLSWKIADTSGISKESLEQIDVAILEGKLGVAENGAVWLDENPVTHRVLPFICQHLVIILQQRSIVSTLHHAYEQIDVSKSAFGVFIAGPSKTADIGQSLVIGVHGPRSLMVYIMRTDPLEY